MGKMKGVVLKQQEAAEDLDSLGQEAHYHHTIDAFMSLIEQYGWFKVVGDLREKMGGKVWQ